MNVLYQLPGYSVSLPLPQEELATCPGTLFHEEQATATISYLSVVGKDAVSYWPQWQKSDHNEYL